jgi:hypothetical protein
MREGQRKPTEVQGSTREVPENTENDPGTSGNLQEFGQNIQASNPSETEAHVKLSVQLREGQKKPKEVPGSPGKT